MNKTVKKYYSTIISWYITLFGLYSIMTRFTMTNLGIEGLPNAILYEAFFIVGFFLALYCLYYHGSALIQKENQILFIFIGVLILSSFYNYHYNLWGNIKTIITFFTQIILFYNIMLYFTKQELQKSIKRLLLLTNFLWIIASLGSLALYAFDLSYLLDYTEDRIIRQGFIDGRLFGFFSDPNFASFTSLLLVYGLFYLMVHDNRFKNGLWCFSVRLSILVHIFYIVLSNSRTVFIIIVFATTLYVIFSTKHHLTWKIAIKRTLLTFIAIIAVYFASLGIMFSIGYMVNPERNVKEDFIREDFDLDNISNNRTTIWLNYLSLYKDKPILGTAPRNALQYATQNEPNGYIAIRQYVTHNGYLSLLVTTGFIGFAVMLYFFVINFLNIKYLIQHKNILNTDSESKLFIIFIFAILAFSFFFTNIFFTNNIETMLLWIGLGYLFNQRHPLT